MAKNYVIRYTDNKSDVAEAIVAIRIATTDYFGMDYGEPWMFFHKVQPPASYDDIYLCARKAGIKAVYHQATS